jgi:hypothetical protein
MSKREDLLSLRNAAFEILGSLHQLWIDRGGFNDLSGRTAGDHLDKLGRVASAFVRLLTNLDEAFALLA